MYSCAAQPQVCGLDFEQSLFSQCAQSSKAPKTHVPVPLNLCWKAVCTQNASRQFARERNKESILKTHVDNCTLVARFHDFITRKSRLVGNSHRQRSSYSQTFHEKDQLLLFHDRNENFPQKPDPVYNYSPPCLD